jgi:hypothetical protein
MTTEEARNTEVDITRTGRGRYGNAHIMCDVNDGLVDIIPEVTPTEDQQAERNNELKERKSERAMAKDRKNTKFGRSADQDTEEAHTTHAYNTPSQRKSRKGGTRKV